MKCFVCNNNKNFTKLFPKFCSTHNYLCEKCGLVFIDQGKDSMQKYYKDDGYFKQSPNKALQKEFISKSMLSHIGQERVKEILEVSTIDLKNKRVLDIGCAYGEILFALKQKFNCDVVGIEPSKEAAINGSNMFNIVIEPLLLEEFLTKNKFDLILCNHTLEHVDDPILFLKNMKRLLKDDGIIYIEVPNILYPSGRFPLETFLYNEHLQTFSSYNLNLLFQKAELYTCAYNDKQFLKFMVKKSQTSKIKIDVITANEIMSFLEEYKEKYSIKDFAYVYVNKFRYLLKLIFFKGIDFIR